MTKHIPVLSREAIDFLRVRKGGLYIDATLGGGGHAALIARRLGRGGKIIAIDRDREAIKIARKRLSPYKKKIIYLHDNFRNLDRILNGLDIKKVDGILFDLGISTYQLEERKRGFSFKKWFDAPMDMRMDSSKELTAWGVVNKYPEERLREIFYRLGEEPYAPKIAKKIVSERKKKPIETVGDFLNVIRISMPPKYRFSRRSHWARRAFQAIRMEVNQELPSIEEAIPKAVSALKKGGRLVIISFHSLEDRIVKNAFRKMSLAGEGEKPLLRLLTKKPVMASPEEVRKNPKSDSAKLRAAERI